MTAVLPTAVDVLTQRITVTVASNLHTPCGDPEQGEEEHGHSALGIYQPREQMIVLDDALGFDQERITLLHECLHALFAVTALDDLLAPLPGIDEHAITVLAPVLLAFLRSNPDMVDFLLRLEA